MGNRKTIIVILIALAMVFPATVLVASNNASATPATGWSTTVIDNSKRWYTSEMSTIKIDNAGHVHMAWISEQKLWYATNKTGAWVTTEVDAFTSFHKVDPTMVIDSLNKVYISYAVYNTQVSNHWVIKLAMIPATGATVLETVSAADADSEYSVVAIDAAGYAHVFYSDKATNSLVEKIRPTTGIWSAPAVLEVLGLWAYQLNAIITPANETYLVFQDYHNLIYGVRATMGGTFTFGTAITLPGGNAQYGPISLVLDSAKNMHISYADDSSHQVVYANNTGAAIGAAWTNFVNVAPWNVGNNYNAENSLVIANGIVNVIYKKDYSLHMDPYNNVAGTFTATTPIETGTSTQPYGGMNSATVSSTGHIYIAYMGYDATLDAWEAIKMDANIVLPGAPLDLAGVPGNKQVNLTYGAASTNGGPAILHYNIYRSTTTDLEVYVNQTTGPVLWFVDTDVFNKIPYFYKVSAVNVNGEGPKTAEITATPVSMPSAPGFVGITNPAYQKVHLNWTAADTNGGDAISAYYIYRSTVAGSEAYLNKTVSGTALSYDDLTVTNGQQYFYTVSAVNPDGFGPNSTEVNITPYWTPSAPGVITPGFTAQAGNTLVVLTWTIPTDKGGYATIGNYTIYSGTYPTLTLLANVSGTTMTYTKTGLTNGQAYYFAIAGVNPRGEGLKSFANATPTASPQPPGASVTLVATGGSGQIVLNWGIPSSTGTQPISDYKIYRGDSATALAYWSHTGSTATTFTDAGLLNSMTYYYTVVAVNSVGDGAQSAAAHATTAATPPAGAPATVSDVVVSPNDGSVAVSWTAPNQGNAPITHYYVYRAIVNDPTQAVLVANLSGSALNFADATAVNGQTYYYWIVTSNSIGASDSAASQAVSPGAKSSDSLLPIILIVVVIIVVVVLVLFLFMRKKKATPAAPPAVMPAYQQPAPQQQYQQQPAAVPGICSKCGTPVSPDFAVCPNCGNKLR